MFSHIKGLNTIKTKKLISTFIFICILLPITGVIAGDTSTFGDRIFQIQRNLALKGNKLAQYKLGTFYEFGVSIKPNIRQARAWYKKAAQSDYTPANHRLTYLDIKQNKYDESKHRAWRESVFKYAEKTEHNALLLLGQMYQNGIAVKKDLKKAINLLSKASSLGHTEIDSEINKINASINRKKQDKNKKKFSAKKKPVKKKKIKKNTAQKDNREAKRRKYEESMRKLRQDQLILEQQQTWSESK